MAEVTASTRIAAPVERVWALMTDSTRYAEWSDPTERVIDPGVGEMRQGFEYREFGGIPPFKSESLCTVTEYQPVQRMVHVSDDGKMKIHLEIVLDAGDGGTQLRLTIRPEPRWFLVLPNLVLWPLLMHRRAQEVMDKTIANAKRELEAAGGAG
ncbi:MAG: SRPBCC family protein [Dehalococcoidia bacterium]